MSRVALALLALAGCTSETVGVPPSPPVGRVFEFRVPVDAGVVRASDRERALASSYVRALSSPGFAGLAHLLDEDAHFTLAGYRDAKGRENIVKTYASLFGGIDQRTVVARRSFLTDASQVLEWTLTGVHKTTQKAVTCEGVSLLFTRDDGSIWDQHVTFDEAALQAQIGDVPKGFPRLPPRTPTTLGGDTIEGAIGDKASLAPARAMLDALENGDENAYVANAAEDVEVETFGSSVPLHAKADLRTYFKAQRKSIGNLDASIDNVWTFPGFAIVEYHVVGEQRGPIGWVPSQKDTLIKLFTVEVVNVRDGKIARIWRYDNPAQILSTP